MSAAPLVVRGLVKAYRRRRVLREVDASVAAGEAVAVLGRNGAGKSTFLGCVTANRRPDAGEVRVCGHDPFSDLAGAARCMGVVPEQPFLYGELTVDEFVSFAAEARGIAPEEGRLRAERLLALLGLEGAGDLLCRELSQGMGRKTAIAAALLHRPRLMILDEALNGLDRPSSARLVEELDLRRREGAAVLLSTHDLEFAGGWCDRGLLLTGDGSAVDLHKDAWDRWRESPSLDPRSVSAR